MKNCLNYKGTYIVSKQALILVCITEPLLCYMNSECAWNAETPKLVTI